MIRIAFCDDKLKELHSIVKVVDSIIINNNFKMEIMKVTNDKKEIYNLVKNYEIDVLMLDIDFDKDLENGLEFANKLRAVNKNFYLVFCTGHFEYALLSFKYKTFDYILKPVTLSVMEDLLKRLNEEFESFKKNSIFTDFVRLKSNVLLNPDDIVYIEKVGHRANIYTTSGSIATYGNVQAFLDGLPDFFLKCHRSYIANSHYINKFDYKKKYWNLITAYHVL